MYRARPDELGPGRGGIGQVHRDLGVLGPPGGTGVLPLDGHHGGALLRSPVSSTTRTAGVGEVLQHIAAQVIPDSGFVPDRAGSLAVLCWTSFMGAIISKKQSGFAGHATLA